MNDNRKKYCTRMTLFFAICYGALLLFIFLPTNFDSKDSFWNWLALACILASAICFWIFIYYLGALVNIYKKSMAVWIGLTFITSPFGAIVAFGMMRGIVKRDLASSGISTGATVRTYDKNFRLK